MKKMLRILLISLSILFMGIGGVALFIGIYFDSLAEKIN
jgi:hypothetical protein